MAKDLDPKLVDQAVNTLRMLAVDAVEAAQSGHPGTPMALAQIAFDIFHGHLRYDPADPAWPDRDRFVLSCGHASMLLYGLLHLAGYDLSLAELRNFRQWGSKTPGHPEAHHTPGVETTTGPLGQGFANAVGMALALEMRRARFGAELVGARVFGIASDGDIQEGVCAEAASLAGHLGLGNLVFFYDDNDITIDGRIELSMSEDVGRRFEAYGWAVQRIDGHDHAQIRAALDRAVAETERPSLIVAKTRIGIGAPKKAGTSKAHGEPLGADEVRGAKEALGWPLEPTFLVPDAVRTLFAERAKEGAAARAAWTERVESFRRQGGKLVATWDAHMGRSVPDDILAQLVAVAPEKPSATRNHAGVIEQRAAALVPALVGGSADLAGSNKTTINGSADVARGRYEGRNLHFGIREHAMGAVVNGMALSRDFIPFGATFLVFSDYMRPAIRLAALSQLQAIFVFTHDSLYLGEDGPTHQPVEHYWALRTIPGLDLVRPADALECAAAWAHALRRTDGPTAMALTRQTVPNLGRPDGFAPDDMLRGAYVISREKGAPKAVVIATGAEVHVALAAKEHLGAAGEAIRVVSAPCLELFERQSDDYQRAVLGEGLPRASVELGITLPWRGIVGDGGLTIGHDDFGHSAPWEVIQEKLRMTGPAIAERLKAWLVDQR
jgi:transketolase